MSNGVETFLHDTIFCFVKLALKEYTR